MHYTDQLGRILSIPATPKKIISLVPSQTEFLFDLGLENEVIAITKFCIHPNSWYKNKIRIGGTKDVDIQKINLLQPDIVIANKEENIKEQVEAIAKNYPVWVSDIQTLSDVYGMMECLGNITGKAPAALHMIERIQAGFQSIYCTPKSNPVRTAYLIWKDPYISIGADTFIHQMMAHCRLKNIFDHTLRYPVVDIQMLKDAGCQLLLLLSEPYPFKQKHIQELQQQLPTTKILLVDGEMFSWYGSRLLLTPAYFNKLIEQVYVT